MFVLWFVCPLGECISTSTMASFSFVRSTTTSLNILTSTMASFDFLRSTMTSFTLFVFMSCASCTGCLINISTNTMVPMRSKLTAMISNFFKVDRGIYKEIKILILEIGNIQYCLAWQMHAHSQNC